MSYAEYDTTVNLLGIDVGVTVEYRCNSVGYISIDKVIGPSGNDILEQLAAYPLNEHARLRVLERRVPVLGIVPYRLLWNGRNILSELYDEVRYAHESGR